MWNGLNKPAERSVTKRNMVTVTLQLTNVSYFNFWITICCIFYFQAAQEAINEELNKLTKAEKNEIDAIPSDGLLGTTCKNSACKAVLFYELDIVYIGQNFTGLHRSWCWQRRMRISSGKSCISRRNEVLVMLWTKDDRFRDIFRPERLCSWKALLVKGLILCKS